jgi:2-polyprenyl-3-methyl-5-hydroxy-6-metoxy-1,4-benzoquinol methylase
MTRWTNRAAIDRWAAMPHQALAEMAEDGDFSKRHLVNPVVLRMLGEVRGRRVLDAGCGNGYLSRMLAGRGARVTGVEPASALFEFAVHAERAEPLGIRYLQADLCQLGAPHQAVVPGGPFDAVVASMVLPAVPDWTGALRACVRQLRPGGRLVFSVNHPCFEQLAATWREHGAYQVSEYLAEYEIEQRYATDFHRPLSAYLNEVIGLGCRIAEVAEPGLDPQIAAEDAGGDHPYVHLPNFLIVAADLDGARNERAAGHRDGHDPRSG